MHNDTVNWFHYRSNSGVEWGPCGSLSTTTENSETCPQIYDFLGKVNFRQNRSGHCPQPALLEFGPLPYSNCWPALMCAMQEIPKHWLFDCLLFRVAFVGRTSRFCSFPGSFCTEARVNILVLFSSGRLLAVESIYIYFNLSNFFNITFEQMQK